MASIGNQQVHQNNGVSSSTVSGYTPPSGDDKIVVVAVYIEDYYPPPSVTSITYGGVAMTQRQTALSSRNRSYVFDIQIGSATTPSDIVVTLNSSGVNLHVTATTLIGVAQQAPEADAASELDYDSTDITTVTDDALLIDFAANGASGTVSPADSGQTELYTEDDNDGDKMAFSSSYKIAGSAGLHTMGWPSGGTRPIHIVLAYEAIAAGVTLDVANGLMSQTAAGAGFTQTHDLALADAIQNQNAGASYFEQAQGLPVSGGHHPHAAPAVTLTTGGQLSVDGAFHVGTAIGSAFAQIHGLQAQAGASLHMAATAQFLTQSEIVVKDALHASGSSGVLFGSGAIVPPERTILPEPAARILTASPVPGIFTAKR